MRYFMLLIIMHIAFSCHATKKCKFTRRYRYEHYNLNGIKLSNPELVDISFYNDHGKNICTISYSEGVFCGVKVYNVDNIGDEIGLYSFDSLGNVVYKYTPLEDTIISNNLPFIEMSNTEMCHGVNVKCIRNRCGNIIKRISYSSDTPKKIISSEEYVYE